MTQKLIHKIKSFFSIFKQTVFPVKCLGCSGPGMYVCGECLAETEINYIDSSTRIDLIIAPFPYSNLAVRKAIHALKYKSAYALAEELADKIFTYSKLHFRNVKDNNSVLVITVPLSAKRKRQRGFNQAEFLARRLSKNMNLEMQTDVLIKIRDTKQQADLKNKKDRRVNVHGCFAVPPEAEPAVKNKIVVLVDDVITTGATVNEAARVLKKARAAKVIAVAVAG